NTYFAFGPTPDVVNPDGSHPAHWFLFDQEVFYDADWRVVGLGDTGMVNSSPMSQMLLVDGDRGDSDLTADGNIVHVGGLAVRVPAFEQPNVASIFDPRGNWVTLTSSPGTRFVNLASEWHPDDLQTGGRIYTSGFFSFTLEGVPVGGTVDVEMNFAQQIEVNTYYKFRTITNG